MNSFFRIIKTNSYLFVICIHFQCILIYFKNIIEIITIIVFNIYTFNLYNLIHFNAILKFNKMYGFLYKQILL